jgi:hypothetical protein
VQCGVVGRFGDQPLQQLHGLRVAFLLVQAVGAFAGAESQLQGQQASQFLHGVGMVVHAQVDVAVVEAAVAAVFAGDEDRGGLLAARIAARRFACLQRCHEFEREFAWRLLERFRHRLHDGFAREDVALRGEVLACNAARPAQAALPCEARAAPLRVHNPHLSLLALWVALRQPTDNLLRGDLSAKQLQPPRSVGRVRVRLSGDSADARLRKRHNGADRQKLRCDRHAHFTRLGIGAHNREGSKPQRIGLPSP